MRSILSQSLKCIKTKCICNYWITRPFRMNEWFMRHFASSAWAHCSLDGLPGRNDHSRNLNEPIIRHIICLITLADCLSNGLSKQNDHGQINNNTSPIQLHSSAMKHLRINPRFVCHTFMMLMFTVAAMNSLIVSG